ncbi:MAG: hypothetical protein HW421_2313 [Ignavibacteria bacterium]|nr:hypothetical protein [Ignavibacteria bacterium]
MKLLFSSTIKFTIIFLLAFEFSFGQKEDNPLLPVARPDVKDVGVILGLGQNFQSGIFKLDCNCEFSGGVKFGYFFGAVYEQHIRNDFRWGLILGYESLGLNSSYKTLETIKIISPTSLIDTFNTTILIRQKADAEFSYLSLAPYLKYSYKWFFLRLGFSAGYNLKATVIQTAELLTTSALIDGKTVELSIDSSSNKGKKISETITELQNGNFKNTSEIRLSLLPMAGLNIPIGDDWEFNPSFALSIPLNYTATDMDFSVNAWRIMLELRYCIFKPDILIR